MTDDTTETGPARISVPRVAFRLAMAALVLFLAVRTYEETGTALARSSGSLHTSGATVTELTGHTKTGSSGGGQDGGGTTYTYTVYTVELRLDHEVKRLAGVSEAGVSGLSTGQRVTAGLWHGRVVEIDGRQVWPGWNRDGWDLALIAVYPLIMGYLIATAVSGAAYLTARGGRARLEPWERVGATFPGILVGLAAITVLFASALAGSAPASWPLIPLGSGLAVALWRLRTLIRRAERAAHAPA
ncbi:hypothetical protein ACFY30_39030 [Streptomyces sp. NPDC000345]|uniref:hypothetical protein n=1 Tax=Streptomyces sp. NPDC000345 TaxID=3364537 RepID=UPI0036997F73